MCPDCDLVSVVENKCEQTECAALGSCLAGEESSSALCPAAASWLPSLRDPARLHCVKTSRLLPTNIPTLGTEVRRSMKCFAY